MKPASKKARVVLERSLARGLLNQANKVYLRILRGFLSSNISTRIGHASILLSFLKESALNRIKCRLTGYYRSRTIRQPIPARLIALYHSLMAKKLLS